MDLLFDFAVFVFLVVVFVTLWRHPKYNPAKLILDRFTLGTLEEELARRDRRRQQRRAANAPPVNLTGDDALVGREMVSVQPDSPTNSSTTIFRSGLIKKKLDRQGKNGSNVRVN
eukprot:GSA120T00007863001.1